MMDCHDIRTLAAERVDALNATGASHAEIKMELAVCNINLDLRARALREDFEKLAGEFYALRRDYETALRKLALPDGVPHGWEGSP